MKGGLILQKQEMTRIWINDEFIPVTILKLPIQYVLRHKIEEKDWYNAVLLWTWKKILNKEKWIKEEYKYVTEFKIEKDYFDFFKVWEIPNIEILNNFEKADLIWYSKGKWFAWVIKRHWFSGWPETHWSQFHRHPWTIWHRKPRRTMKWHPLPWHMWNERITLKNIKIVDKMNIDWEDLIFVKWSVPGYYWSYVKLVLF